MLEQLHVTPAMLGRQRRHVIELAAYSGATWAPIPRHLVVCTSATITFGDWQLVGRAVTRIEARGKNLLIHCAPLVAAAGKPDPRDTPQLPVAIGRNSA